MMKQDPQQEPDFFDKQRNIDWILRIFYALCAILVLLDFVVHRHIYVSFEELPTFYALYGFVACVVLVLIAKEMRKLLMRKEDYYEPLEQELLDTRKDDENKQGGHH